MWRWVRGGKCVEVGAGRAGMVWWSGERSGEFAEGMMWRAVAETV